MRQEEILETLDMLEESLPSNLRGKSIKDIRKGVMDMDEMEMEDEEDLDAMFAGEDEMDPEMEEDMDYEDEEDFLAE